MIDVEAHVIVATDDSIAAPHCLSRMPLAWERCGSFMPASLGVEWRAGPEFYRWFSRLRPAPTPTDDGIQDRPIGPERGGLPGGGERVDLKFAVEWKAADKPGPGAQSSTAPKESVRFNVTLRLLWPDFYADYRVGAERLAEQFLEMKGSGPGPERRVLIGITDMDLDQPVEDGVGSGVDQLLNPMALPRLHDALGDPRPTQLNSTLAVTGFERIFSRFFDLARDNVREDFGRLPWANHPNAFSAARDPAVMIPLLGDVVERRFHLLTLLQNDLVFRKSSKPLAVMPVIPCGFLCSGFRGVNYNPETGTWLFGDWDDMVMRGERDEPYVVPYACCDALLAPLLGIRMSMQIHAGAARLRGSRLGNILRAFGSGHASVNGWETKN